MSRAIRRRIPPRTHPRPINRLRLGVALAAALILASACGGSSNGTTSAPAIQRVARASLAPGGHALERPLPPNWAITMQVWFPARSSMLRVRLGSAVVTVFDGSHIWHHVKLTRRGLVVDGRRNGASPLEASRVSLRAVNGPVDVRRLVIRRD